MSVHGLTPFNYLQRKRAKVAVRLLQRTQLTVDEIASAVGFAHRQTLRRNIQRLTGLLPLKVRVASRREEGV